MLPEIRNIIKTELMNILEKEFTLDDFAVLERFEPEFISNKLDEIVEEIDEITCLYFEDIQNEVNYILERVKIRRV